MAAGWRAALPPGRVTTSAAARWHRADLAHDVERVLADVDTDHRGDRYIELAGHGLLLVFGAPCQLLSLVGPEHSRTIPLPDMIHETGEKITVMIRRRQIGSILSRRIVARRTLDLR